jgi:hypothetical protein
VADVGSNVGTQLRDHAESIPHSLTLDDLALAGHRWLLAGRPPLSPFGPSESKDVGLTSTQL